MCGSDLHSGIPDTKSLKMTAQCSSFNRRIGVGTNRVYIILSDVCGHLNIETFSNTYLFVESFNILLLLLSCNDADSCCSSANRFSEDDIYNNMYYRYIRKKVQIFFLRLRRIYFLFIANALHTRILWYYCCIHKDKTRKRFMFQFNIFI